MDVSRLDVENLLRQQGALAALGTYAFREPLLSKVLNEAARICAESLHTKFCKICRYRPASDDLIIEFIVGFSGDVLGATVKADDSTPQGRAFRSRGVNILNDLRLDHGLILPAFYPTHHIGSTIDMCIQSHDETPYGVLEVASTEFDAYDDRDIAFLTGFTNVLSAAVASTERTELLKLALDRMTALVDEKAVLARELQHRVRNNLQLINGMLTEQIRRTSDTSAQDGIRAIVRRVMSLSTIYDHLLGVGMRRDVDFGEYIKLLSKNLSVLQDNTMGSVVMLHEIEPIILDLDTVTSLGLALVEAISNSYQHAFSAAGGIIRVRLRIADADTGLLQIEDNGRGFVEGPLSKRHGLGLIRRLMQQVKGTAELASSNAGAIWSLRFPLKTERQHE